MESTNDTSVTKFLDDTAVTEDNVNMTVIQFLADTLVDELVYNDISVTKFLDNATVTETRQNNVNMAIIEFLDSMLEE